MARKEDGDSEKRFFQVDRFYQTNGEWFYTTREGEEKGPFESKDEAEGDLIAYIIHLKNLEGFGNKS
jgi:hypothetical protein